MSGPAWGVVLADAEGVMTVMFALFAIVSWVIKLVNAAKGEPEAPANKPKAPRPRSLEDEIANFLKEVNTRKGEGAQPAAPADRRQAAEVIFEDRPAPFQPIEPRPAAARPVEARPAAKRPAKPATAGSAGGKTGKGQRPAKPSNPKAESADRTTKPLGSQAVAGAEKRVAAHASELGQGVQQHLKSHMAERIGQMVTQDMAPRISESVASHLGSVSGSPGAATVAKVPQHPLVAELRQPQTLQKALVASLILAPPRALASRR